MGNVVIGMDQDGDDLTDLVCDALVAAGHVRWPSAVEIVLPCGQRPKDMHTEIPVKHLLEMSSADLVPLPNTLMDDNSTCFQSERWSSKNTDHDDGDDW